MKLKRLSLFLALVMILSAFAGTFTISSAATTAGGTFEIWRGGVKVDTVTGQVAKQTLQDGDEIILKSDYVITANENDATFAAGIIINGDSDGDNTADYTVTMSARWFNYGYATKPDDDTTGNANYNVSFAGKTLTFKNLKIVVTGTCNGIVQSQNKDATIVVDNCDIEYGSTDGRGFITANGANQTVTVRNTRWTMTAGASTGARGMISIHTADTTVTITDSDFVGKGFVSGSGVTNGGCFFFTSGANTEVTMTRVSMDSSAASYHRLAYTNGNATDWTIEDSIFVGSNNSHDVFQVKTDTTTTANSTTMTFKDVVFMGGGSESTGDQIIRNYSAVSYYNSNDTYNQIRVLGRSAAYTSDEALLKHFGKDPTVTGTNYDKAAAAMGYKVRLTDAATAYANGKFTGYYTCWIDALNTIGGSISKDTTAYVIGDFHNNVEKTGFLYANSAKLTIEGIDADGDGNYPTITSTTAMYRAEYLSNNAAQTAGTMVYKNLNFVMPNSWFGQLNYGTMTVENCNIECATTNACGIVIQSGTIFNLINSTVVCTGAGSNLRLNAANATANITNSTVETTNASAFPVNVNAESALNITKDSRFVTAGGQGIYITDGKTLTLNGTNVTSSITAGAMLEGASVRVARAEAGQEELSNSGIRFESTLTAAQVAAAKAAGATTVTYGTVIFRYEDLDGMSVAELVAAANADAEDDLKVADIPAVSGKVGSDAEGYTIRAALVNIKTNHYDTQFGAVAYIELTYANGSTVRIYGDFDATENVRSIKSVAEAALADTKTKAEITENGSATFDGYVYHNEITTDVYSCYSDEQIAILKTYAGVQ